MLTATSRGPVALVDTTTGALVPFSFVTEATRLLAAIADHNGWYFRKEDWLPDLLDPPAELLHFGIQIPDGIVAVAVIAETPDGNVHIHRMDTLADYRGRIRGLGTLMVKYSALHALEHGADHSLHLWAIRSAIGFYHKLGFIEDIEHDCLRPDEGIWMLLDECGIKKLLDAGGNNSP